MDNIVVLTNADVVFDSTLERIDTRNMKKVDHVFVLSVQQPAQHGRYKNVHNRECSLPPRCTIGRIDGWLLGGSSWDSYVFNPSSHRFQKQLDLARFNFHMFNTGGENIAGYELYSAGFTMSNPCEWVRAEHWHCRGEKMHDDSQETILEERRPEFHDMMPCYDCPNIKIAEIKDFHGIGKLCTKGKRLNSNLPQFENHTKIERLFRNPQHIDLCCSTDDCEVTWRKLIKKVPTYKSGKTMDVWMPAPNHKFMCEVPEDIDCVINKDYAKAGIGNCGRAYDDMYEFFNADPAQTGAR